MSREIKFRGKDEDTGEWRYGGYHKHQITEICPVQFYGESEEDKTPKYIHYIIMDGFADWNMEKHNVIPETVGQYTGLKDKNGKEIYEGDIVKYFLPGWLLESWICKVSYDNGDVILEDDKDQVVNIKDYVKHLEVIGNIYDNHELLGGE